MFQELDGSIGTRLESGHPSEPRLLAESARRNLSSPTIETVIGAGSHLEGRLTAEDTVRIQGTVQGELTSSQAIIIEASGRVTATVTAAQVLVAGQIDGQVRGNGRVELRATARVRGELQAAVLVIHEGAVFDGRASMTDPVTRFDGRPQKAEPANRP